MKPKATRTKRTHTPDNVVLRLAVAAVDIVQFADLIQQEWSRRRGLSDPSLVSHHGALIAAATFLANKRYESKDLRSMRD